MCDEEFSDSDDEGEGHRRNVHVVIPDRVALPASLPHPLNGIADDVKRKAIVMSIGQIYETVDEEPVDVVMSDENSDAERETNQNTMKHEINAMEELTNEINGSMQDSSRDMKRYS